MMRLASRLAGRVRAIENERRLAWAVRQFRHLESAAQPRAQLFEALRSGWGNQGWSADAAYLAAIYQKASAVSGPVLECGSGVSTLLLALIAEKRNIAVHSLEHLPIWRNAVLATLARHDLRAKIHLAPLREYDDFDWYDLPLGLPEHFPLVVCDGPPGQTRGGRYGLLNVCGDRLRGSIILMDDAERPSEQHVTEAWNSEFGARSQIVTTPQGRYATIQVPG